MLPGSKAKKSANLKPHFIAAYNYNAPERIVFIFHVVNNLQLLILCQGLVRVVLRRIQFD
jgi:hypothetical protein